MKIYVNASNVHVGGGNTLLSDFLVSAKEFDGVDFHIYIDPRFDPTLFESSNIAFEVIPVFKRYSIFNRIKKVANDSDMILCFGNVPPRTQHDSKVILLQSNRFLVDNYTLKGLTLRTKVRIILERIIFKKGIQFVDYLIVQSESMSDCTKSILKGSERPVIKVWPFKNNDKIKLNSLSEKQSHSTETPSFIYIANLEPYKNHRRLVQAWINLKEAGTNPKLVLTIDSDSFPKDYAYILECISDYQLNIDIKPKLKRDELLQNFSEADCLIYPSLFESYGLPMVEAMQMKIPIIASELDYVRDLADPVETFDPKSPKSISRAVLRFINNPSKKARVLSGKSFIENILTIEKNA